MENPNKMKNYSFYKTMLFTFLLTLCSVSCQKAPIDEHIQGFWALKKFTTQTDNVSHPCERLYYSIGRYVTEISERQGPNGYGHFVGLSEFRDNNSILVLKDFKHKNVSQGDSGEKAQPEDLLPYGICSQEETVFRIVHCNGKTMTLESDYARLELERF